MKPDSRGNGLLHALLIAVDGGPRETLGALCGHTGGSLADVDRAEAENESYWSDVLAVRGLRLVVVGTSDSTRGRRIEGVARRAARAAGIPVAAIEDFPGNYAHVDGGEASLVIVESDAAAEIARARLGARTPSLAVLPPIRHQGYRTIAHPLRQRTAERWASERGCRVLWAGQPETADCLVTLRHVLPALKACNANLLFKPHPRDPGLLSGAYRELLTESAVDWCDVSAHDAATALEQAPRLVITQFSSVALEAGYYGIPSVWVLLAGAGGDRLQEKKGYRVPALCAAGGAALAQRPEDVEAVVARALRDRQYRASLMRAFDGYCGVREAVPGGAAGKLLALLNQL